MDRNQCNWYNLSMNNRFGFTLVELIVVIAIIGILSAIGFTSFTNIQRNSRASRIASDFQQIDLAWKVWKNANDAPYPRESDLDANGVTDPGYGSHPDLACADEPGIFETPADLYLEDEYADPWSIRYSYDNDGDTFPASGLYSGVNVFASWCAGNGARYIEAAIIMDRSIDNGDGATTGRLRWQTDPNVNGAIIFMISPDEDQ